MPSDTLIPAEADYPTTERSRVRRLVPAPDIETPKLILSGDCRGWKQVLSDGGGRAVAEAPDQPGRVVGLLEGQQRAT